MVRDLAQLTRVSPVEMIKDLIKNGVMANVNQVIDYQVAAALATELGFDVKQMPEVIPGIKDARAPQSPSLDDEDSPQSIRPPVVTILGHVDHGKTSLLDLIRRSDVAAKEVGGITQRIGAYQVEVDGRKITFLDTPGHEAFTAIRARGAQVTDIAVLVVAAEDGVMPQTLEAIDHAKAAGVPIVVAINKTDLPNADPERVKRQMAEQNLLVEEWGGDVICIAVSAKTGGGVQELLENILILAEVLELKTDPEGKPRGVVIEAELDNTRGPMTTVLVQSGTIKVGNVIVVGDTCGRIKAMFDYQGRNINDADPSTPVKIMGLNQVPRPGDVVTVAASEKEARAILEEKERQRLNEALRLEQGVRLQDIYHHLQSGQVKQLNIVLRTDFQGSIDALRNSLEKLGGGTLRVNIIRAAPGNISESDILLALASKGIVLGFNTRIESGARKLADQEGVEVRHYDIIYQLVEDVDKALKGLLEPTYVDVVDGRAEVKQAFNISKRGPIAGVLVTEGRVTRGALARVVRRGRVVYDSKLDSLKHFKDDVREVRAGSECGMGIEGFEDFQPGDILEVYRKEQAAPA
ncbi:MAG: infB [Dehalococcoidia bacterium]|nr:infB [Dehalococcoidia bacterium]